MHKTCFACGQENPHGLQLHFEETDTGMLKSQFLVTPQYCNSTGFCHRGIIMVLLDSVMVNLLIRRQIKALTGSMDVQFTTPIPPGTHITVNGHITRTIKNIFYTCGSVCAHQTTYAQSTAKYLQIN